MFTLCVGRHRAACDVLRRESEARLLAAVRVRHCFPLQVSRSYVTHLSICPSAHPSVRPFIRPSIHLSAHPSILLACLSAHPSVRQSVRPPTRPLIHPSTRPPIRPFVRTSVRPSVRLPIHPSVLPSVPLSARPPSFLAYHTMRPSVLPSVPPSVRPSVRPSARPPVCPSVHPSFRPCLHPSLRPPAIIPGVPYHASVLQYSQLRRRELPEERSAAGDDRHDDARRGVGGGRLPSSLLRPRPLHQHDPHLGMGSHTGEKQPAEIGANPLVIGVGFRLTFSLIVWLIG